MSHPEVLPEAEPWSSAGGPVGALCIHGFTGNPSAMRPVAEAFAAAGYSVELPRLPGHGTTVEEMMTTGWADWTAEAEAAFQRISATCERVVVAGLSMGGALTLWLAERHPEIVGIVCINPATMAAPAEVLDMVRGMVDEGTLYLRAVGNDIAKPDVFESAYAQTPLPPLLSLMDGLEGLQARMATTTTPLLLLTSAQDHVVEPAQGDHLASTWGGLVERVSLERSYHVATLDHDAPIICERALEFAERVGAR